MFEIETAYTFAEAKILCAEGWQPFAVTETKTHSGRIGLTWHFRRQIEAAKDNAHE